MAEKDGHFQLNSGGSFASRSSDIFGNLDAIEKKHEAKEKARDKFSRDRHKYMNDDPVLDFCAKPSSSRHEKSSSRQDSQSGWSGAARDYEERGSRRESQGDEDKDGDRDRDGSDRSCVQFKAPRGRAPRARFVADHKKHPEKYTYYNLGDVSADQMSNSSNAAAAFDFLRQRKELNSMNEEESTDAGDSFKPVMFKKPKKMTKTETESSMSQKDEQKSEGDKQPMTFQAGCSGKFEMAEYVVGQNAKMSKDKKACASVATSDKVGLQHLFEEDEESDEDSPEESSQTKGRNIRKRTHSSDEDD